MFLLKNGILGNFFTKSENEHSADSTPCLLFATLSDIESFLEFMQLVRNNNDISVMYLPIILVVFAHNLGVIKDKNVYANKK